MSKFIVEADFPLGRLRYFTYLSLSNLAQYDCSATLPNYSTGFNVYTINSIYNIVIASNDIVVIINI